MADSLARAQLARAANRLRRAAQSPLPALVLLTDDERLPNPAAAIAALPRGSLVILRTRDTKRGIALAGMMARLIRERSLTWIIAGDPLLASQCDANGVHFPERNISSAAHWRALRPDWLITCAAHSLRACCRAAQVGAHAALLAPVLSTTSHPGAPALGIVRARQIARQAPLPVYALGGVDALTAQQFVDSAFVGLAAIGGLSVQLRDASRCTGNATNV
ncbi:MAG TPA: thiamine phosphate synthase [Rhizomicrobium sp.]